MHRGWRRIGRDLKERRHIDAYSIAFVTFILAVLSLVPSIVPDELRWAALLAGVGVLVWRITIPERLTGNMDDLLNDRLTFDRLPLSERLRDAKEVCIFAPSAINILSAQNCELLRTGILNRPDGIVRVVVLDPENESVVQLATRQLDDSLDYPLQDFRASLQATVRQLGIMASWHLKGSFDHRIFDYNPGFSLVCIDPTSRKGHVIVEFHGFHNEATSSRMHIEISRQQSEHWYTYWTNQFNRIWDTSLPQAESSNSISPTGQS
jgi:hypothetical protein